jgi:hypothetical protein
MTVAAALSFLIMQRYAALGMADSAEAYKLISAGMAIIPPAMPSHCLSGCPLRTAFALPIPLPRSHSLPQHGRQLVRSLPAKDYR